MRLKVKSHRFAVYIIVDDSTVGVQYTLDTLYRFGLLETGEYFVVAMITDNQLVTAEAFFGLLGCKSNISNIYLA